MEPSDRRYSRDHEWVKVEGERGTVGITDFAQKQLGDVVFLELPEVGKKLKAHERFGTVESVKAVSELFCPVSGEVAEANSGLADKPETVNADPYGAGWMIRLKLADPGEAAGLMDAAQYSEFVAKEAK
jgi:glycine cleavage system H protein